MAYDEVSVPSALGRLQAGDANGAIAILEQVLIQNPNDGPALQYLGVARAQVGDTAGGIEALQRAAAVQPDSAATWFNLGVALNRAERTSEAREALERALALDPSHAKARAALNALAPQAPAFPPPPPLSSIPPPPGVYPAAADTPNPYAGRPGYGRDAGPIPPAAPVPSLGAAPPGVYSAARIAPGGIAMRDLAQRPSSGRRILRGIGWGALCGQYWTALNAFWFLVEGGMKQGSTVAVFIIATAILFAFVGSICGAIIGATNSDVRKGAVVGVVAGLLLFVGELALSGFSPVMIVNVFFWFYTGRTVGANVASKVQRPVNQ